MDVSAVDDLAPPPRSAGPRPARRFGAGPTSASVPQSFLPHALAMLAAIGISYIPDPLLALRLLCALSCFYALFMVATRGSSYLVPSGIYFLASGVFIGLGSLYLTQVGSLNEFSELRDWAVVAFVTTAGTAMVVTAISIQWKLTWPSNRERDAARQPVPVVPKYFQILALAMVAVSQLSPLRGLNTTVTSAVGLAGVMMLVLGASARRVKMRWGGDVVLVALAVVVPLLWIQLEFEGGGRLTLAGLGVASLMGWSLVRPRRIQKVAVVLAIPLFLIFSGLNRLEKDAARNAGSSGVLTDGQGLGSMYGPLDTWTELATADPEVQARNQASTTGPVYGQTFLNTLYLPIPRLVWEDKPKGFGAQLTEILRPTLLREERIAPEHSMAALVTGEFYVNFGLVGLGILPLAVGWFLALLDRAHRRLVTNGLRTIDDWWRGAILMCLAASLGDLFWVGSFTFFARGGMAAVMAWIVWRLSTRRSPPTPTVG